MQSCWCVCVCISGVGEQLQLLNEVSGSGESCLLAECCYPLWLAECIPESVTACWHECCMQGCVGVGQRGVCVLWTWVFL